MNKEFIKIFDTTLRDGQQCQAQACHLTKNIEYAKLARTLGVDILEAGLPAASKLDFKIVNEIAKFYSEAKNSTISKAIEKIPIPSTFSVIEKLRDINKNMLITASINSIIVFLINFTILSIEKILF